MIVDFVDASILRVFACTIWCILRMALQLHQHHSSAYRGNCHITEVAAACGAVVRCLGWQILA